MLKHVSTSFNIDKHVWTFGWWRLGTRTRKLLCSYRKLSNNRPIQLCLDILWCIYHWFSYMFITYHHIPKYIIIYHHNSSYIYMVFHPTFVYLSSFQHYQTLHHYKMPFLLTQEKLISKDQRKAFYKYLGGCICSHINI